MDAVARRQHRLACLLQDGRLLVALDNGLYLFDPRDGAVVPFADPNQGRAGLAYNDGKVDRHGNYWIGNFDATESAPRGVLYSLNRRDEWRIGDSGFVVCSGGGKVLRLAPTGETLDELPLPARNLTSCCLGGKDLRSLVVTSGIVGQRR